MLRWAEVNGRLDSNANELGADMIVAPELERGGATSDSLAGRLGSEDGEPGTSMVQR